jgi:predicted Zn-dependent protease
LLFPKSMASSIAQHTPQWFEDILGRTAAEEFLKTEETCSCSVEQEKALIKLLSSLQEASHSKRQFKIYFIHSKAPPNAFAFPSGDIIINSALMETVQTANELAGVLAHEMAHVIAHHSSAALVNHLGLRLVVKVILNLDADALVGLLNNPFNQIQESEADSIAAQMLYQANIGSEGLQSFFIKLKMKEDKNQDPLSLLSTHPLTEERIRLLGKAVQPSSVQAIVTPSEWATIKSICAQKSQKSANLPL